MNRFIHRRFAIAIYVAFFSSVSFAQIFTKLVDFNPALGAHPYFMTFVQGTDGNLYGTTSNIGAQGGTFYRITPNGVLTVLYTFCSQPNCTDGNNPASGVVLGTDGSFYGVTYTGGTSGQGTVFKITPDGTLTTIHSFCVQTGCPDGRVPVGGLVEATNNSLYGTTSVGGLYGDGTIFRISPTGAFTTLHSFSGSDGSVPLDAMVEGNDGNLYGTTQGAAKGNGTIFRIALGGQFTNLNLPGGYDSSPEASLLPIASNVFYGTAQGGPSNYGAIFSITADNHLSNLYVFCQQAGCPDGGGPVGIIYANDGNAYGMTAIGGTSPVCEFDCGTIYQLTSSNDLSTVHNFCEQSGCMDGNQPDGSLFQATDGKFYGTTFSGGIYQGGVAFSLDTGLSRLVRFVVPAGRIGGIARILGQGFTGATSVDFNGVPAEFKIRSDTFIEAGLSRGATTGYVTVATPTGTLTSNVPFRVIP
jgi:uncharacterized repeat protein (TIGR03803 family)